MDADGQNVRHLMGNDPRPHYMHQSNLADFMGTEDALVFTTGGEVSPVNLGLILVLLGVALLMDGGTASVYGPRAWEAFQQFAERRPAPVEAVG